MRNFVHENLIAIQQLQMTKCAKEILTLAEILQNFATQ